MKTSSTLVQWAAMLFVTLSFIPQLSAFDSNCDNEEDLFSIYCPDDVTVSCNAELWDLSIYGNANYHDYTGWHSAGYPTENWNLNSCNSGTITRTWTVEDYNWNWHTCTQTITVGGGAGAFGYYDIQWPLSHLELQGCNPSTHPSQLPPEYGWPTYNYSECSNVGVSYSDCVYTVNDGCKKIIRKWTVRDWCQSNNNGWGYGTQGSWTYDQVIKIMGGEEPTVECTPKIEVGSYNCVNAYVHADPIYVHGETCGGNYTITNNSPYADSNGANISGTYPIGYTNVDYIVHYGCGKKKTCRTKVIVQDKKGPTVYCYGEITVALMPVDEDQDGVPEDGMIEIWAKDLDKGSTASCNGYGLTYSFSEDITDTNKTFTCADVGSNEVRMYVTDNHGRQSYCLVKVNVQNNGANIPDCEPEDDTPTGGGDDSTYVHPRFSIAGLVVAEEEPFAKAEFTLTNMQPVVEYVTTLDTILETTTDSFINASGALLYYTLIDSVFTSTTDTVESYFQHYSTSDEEGHFIFEEIADSNTVFTLEAAVVEQEIYKGIDEDDLDFLLGYLLGNIEFERLEQYIAADVNSDRKIDFDDLKILLDHLSGGASEVLDYDWVVIEQQNADADLKDLFANYKEISSMTVEAEDHMDLKYIAVKIGDVVNKEVEGDLQSIPVSDIAYAVQRADDEHELELELRSMISEVQSQSVAISPNPFLDRLNINYMDNSAGLITIQILDVKGQTILSHSTNTVVGENNLSLDMAPYKNTGILVYRIIDGEQLLSGKILRI